MARLGARALKSKLKAVELTAGQIGRIRRSEFAREFNRAKSTIDAKRKHYAAQHIRFLGLYRGRHELKPPAVKPRATDSVAEQMQPMAATEAA